MRSPLFFFNEPPTPGICTLSLHDALPIFRVDPVEVRAFLGTAPASEQDGHPVVVRDVGDGLRPALRHPKRSEEHTSELQSQSNLVCRLLLEKKNVTSTVITVTYSTCLH